MLLVLASAAILRSEPRGTNDHTLLSQTRDSPNLEGQVIVFISPRNRVAQIYPQALGSLFIASYDSQGVEAGSNTSTVTLRVVGGDEKGTLKFERVKYGRESQGIRTRERLRWQGPAAYTKDRPVLSSERAPHKNKTITVKQ
jgi:hypothetical protein